MSSTNLRVTQDMKDGLWTGCLVIYVTATLSAQSLSNCLLKHTFLKTIHMVLLDELQCFLTSVAKKCSWTVYKPFINNFVSIVYYC